MAVCAPKLDAENGGTILRFFKKFIKTRRRRDITYGRAVTTDRGAVSGPPSVVITVVKNDPAAAAVNRQRAIIIVMSKRHNIFLRPSPVDSVLGQNRVALVGVVVDHRDFRQTVDDGTNFKL